MSRRRVLAERVASVRGVEKPTIVCNGRSGYFYVRLPGWTGPVGGWDTMGHARAPRPFTWDEALARVALYYAEQEKRRHHLGSLGLGALGA